MRPLDDILIKHRYDRFQVPLMQRQQPDKKQKHRGISFHTNGSSPIDYDMWEPLANWIENFKWTTSSASDGNFKDRYNRSITWCEIIIAFQYQSGYKVKSKDTPLATQLACVKAAFLRLARDSRIFKYKHKKTFNEHFSPKCKITSLRALTGEDLPGLQRRPIFDDAIWQHIEHCHL